jgi:hypothetical protein
MTSSALNLLITGRISGNDFSALLADEITTYGTLIKKMGAGIPLVFNEDEAIAIDHVWLKGLLKEVLTGSLNTMELAYICDCLTLGERVTYSDGKLKDIIFEIADPEINGGFSTISEIEVLINQLNK